MRTIKGPALLIAQLADDKSPFDSLPAIARWAASLGYKGLQLPSLDTRFIDVARCAESQTYADEITGTMREAGLAVTELVTALEGQCVAVHPAFDILFDQFAPARVRGNPKARQAWAVAQLKLDARAAQRLGLKVVQSFTGSLAWPYVYPWPQRPPELVEEAFAELSRRWRPILDAFDEAGVDIGFELHPCEDVFDGETFEQFLDAVGHHPVATSTTMRVTSSSKASTMSNSSTSIIPGSRVSTSRTRSFDPTASRDSIRDIGPG